MEVKVKLFASLRHGRFKEERADVVEQSRVMDVIRKYEIPADDVSICLVNGRDADMEHVLRTGDTVSLFPPVGGG